MIKIAPSILSADFANLERDIRRISTADYVHVDVMDGVFVPNITIGIPVVKSLRPTTDLPLDVHLMIVRPVRYVEQFCDAGADLVTVHVESDTEENLHAAIGKIHARGKRAGVVLKPGTPAEAALPFLREVELILVMTVEPGFGGQTFMADQMEKVSALRRLIDEQNPACELEVDGGVDPETCRTCIRAGANVLVAGSAVYRAADIPARIRELRGGADA
ncbi:ribulose-phosphate 3-epimerase [uncultured Oscillibacter sp.]|uniref:ribulose-phosphate 3-epimerase n=1 Tax=uncultured Oscillibacter sp. TaxID=876091 RepID=UPI0025E4831B|nr:ribulose-phosphate 3-epimerase [uncultured Oscillibacter sp.]